MTTPVEGDVQAATRSELAIHHATAVLNSASARTTMQGYKKPTEMYCRVLEGIGIDPENVDASGTRNKAADPMAASLLLIMMRCGPKSEGYEGLFASSTSDAIKSAVVNFWKVYGKELSFLSTHAVHFQVILSSNPRAHYQAFNSTKEGKYSCGHKR